MINESQELRPWVRFTFRNSQSRADCHAIFRFKEEALSFGIRIFHWITSRPLWIHHQVVYTIIKLIVFREAHLKTGFTSRRNRFVTWLNNLKTRTVPCFAIDETHRCTIVTNKKIVVRNATFFILFCDKFYVIRAAEHWDRINLVGRKHLIGPFWHVHSHQETNVLKFYSLF